MLTAANSSSATSSDAVAAALLLVLVVSDDAAGVEVAVLAIPLDVLAVDEMTPGDDAQVVSGVVQGLAVSVADTAAPDEAVTPALPLALTVSDAESASDGVSGSIPLGVQAEDDLFLIDFTSPVIPMRANSADGVPVIDGVSLAINPELFFVDDTAMPTDFIAVLFSYPAIALSVFDADTVVDSALASFRRFRHLRFINVTVRNATGSDVTVRVPHGLDGEVLP